VFLPPCSQAVTLRSRYRGAGGVPGRSRHLVAGVPARPHRRRTGGAACARAGQAPCGSRIAHGRSPARGTAHRRRGRLTGPDAVGHHRSELSAHSANLRQASPICILGSRPCRPRRTFRSARRRRLCAGPPPAFRTADRDCCTGRALSRPATGFGLPAGSLGPVRRKKCCLLCTHAGSSRDTRSDDVTGVPVQSAVRSVADGRRADGLPLQLG
jgi:hypothetical protein